MEDSGRPFQIFVKLLDGRTTTLKFTPPNTRTASIKQRIFEITRIPTQTQRLICNGRQLREDSVISTPECTVHLLLPLVGGKGGFGSLLRGAATKAGQKKTNNFDACRDMSGRRLRHVNAEKKLEEWKAEEEERRLEKIAEEFIKKSVKKGKKGVGDGEAAKYVAEYRKQSAKCAKEVEEAVREACGNGKRKGKAVKEGLDAKRLKIWMGKRKLGESDSRDSSDDEESDNEKSVVLTVDNSSDFRKESDGSSDSVTGGKQDGDQSGGSCESGSEEEKDAAVAVDPNLKSSPPRETVTSEGLGMVEPEIHQELVPESASVTCTGVAEISEIDAVDAAKHETVRVDSQPLQASSPASAEVVESKPVTSDSGTVAGESRAPLNFDDFSSAVELEAFGLERLKTELQAYGLKCGGTLQERAARLFLLKTTPLDKLPKKLLAKK